MLLINGGILRSSKNRCGGGKYEVLDLVGHHAVQEALGRMYIVLIVFGRIHDRLAHFNEGREMHDRRNVAGAEEGTQQFHIIQAALHQLETLNKLPAPGRQVVQDHKFYLLLREQQTHVRADITSAPYYQYCHVPIRFV